MSKALVLDGDPIPGLRFETHADYYAWNMAQPTGGFERLNGRVYPMASERAVHLRRKASAYVALRDAIAAAGVPCQALPDGATVEIGTGSNFEPDALVNFGRPMEDGEIAVPCPIIVVEVPSPPRKLDSTLKLPGYFSVPSIAHYLLIHSDRRVVVHHRRDGDRIETRIVSGGMLVFDPPGLRIEFDALFRD